MINANSIESSGGETVNGWGGSAKKRVNLATRPAAMRCTASHGADLQGETPLPCR